jgi:hypothetical protein
MILIYPLLSIIIRLVITLYIILLISRLSYYLKSKSQVTTPTFKGYKGITNKELVTIIPSTSKPTSI